MVSTLPSLSLNQAALPTGVLAMPSTVRRPGWSYSSNSTPRRRSSATSASTSSPSHPVAPPRTAVHKVLDDPGGELVLGRTRGAGGKQQDQPVLATAVQHSLRFLLAGGETELVRIPGAGPGQVAGRDGGVHVTAAQHTALRWSSGAIPIITPTGAGCRAGSPDVEPWAPRCEAVPAGSPRSLRSRWGWWRLDTAGQV